MKWLDTTGGPFLLLEDRLLHAWHGVGRTSLTDSKTDYERACDIADYAKLISIDQGQGIVFGDEPDSMGLIQQATGSVLFIRWKWAPSEEAILKGIQELDFTQNRAEERITLSIESPYVRIFDTSYSGNSIEESFELSVKPGTFLLDTAFFEEGNTCILAHRLSAVG